MENPSKFFWWKLVLVFPSVLEESLIWQLNKSKISRFSIEYPPENTFKKSLNIWLPSFEWAKEDRENLELSLMELGKVFNQEFFSIKWDKIINEDWSLSWKKFWSPDPIGDNILILPSWLGLPEIYNKRIVIKLDPGSAFGTGSHPTTRLCLEALERNPPLGLKVVDIGCGSGILGIAALKLGASNVSAVDIDSLAVKATSRNASLNGLDATKLSVSVGSIDLLLNQGKNFEKGDLLLCNTLAPVIKELTPYFSKVTLPVSDLFLSGLLVEQVEDITSDLIKFGWTFVSSYNQTNWALIHLSRSRLEA
ncbi:50S ribosomal protein L11 methyltransferase [Prochlorococcus marinus]|uniref:50S ribosomal protein L11 methyltransferase n=1 Tax=Prochlorococcus marinus TaxID=1219 RepID=UPI0022B4C177|nr:50S ribosomal protein L11 methyltransferase [Prochlorococcus marinus]